MRAPLAILASLTLPLMGANLYVDSSATGSNNGTSWANAWTSPPSITGVSAGDTVYISGGPAGGTQIYSMGAYWQPAGGSAGNPVTYKIGQDSAHNGTAIFSGSGTWLSGCSYVVISGDSGDGAQHIKLTGYPTLASSVSYTKLDYIISTNGLGAANDTAFRQSDARGIEVSYCYFRITVVSTGHAFVWHGVGGTGWDDCVIHHSTFLVPYSGSGLGCDGFYIDGNGWSVTNNTVLGYYAGPTATGDHADGVQSAGGRWIRIENNVFGDFANYSIYGEALTSYSGYSDVRVLNNLSFISDYNLISSGHPAGIVFGPNGSWSSPPVFTNVVIANNACMDIPSVASAYLGNNDAGRACTFVDCRVENNVALNSADVWLQNNSTTPHSGNVSVTSANGGQYFKTYTAWSGTNNDLHLLTNALPLISAGTNLSAIFAQDKDGSLRTNSGPWDVGPYVLNAATGTNAPVGPGQPIGLTYYVATNGLASNSGTNPASPWSIDYAFLNTWPSNTIVLSSGVYTVIQPYVLRSGQTIVCSNKWGAVLINSPDNTFFLDGADYVTVSGICISNSTRAAIEMMNGRGCVFRDLRIVDTGVAYGGVGYDQSGIDCYLITNCVFERILSERNGKFVGYDHGLYVAGESNIVRNCVSRWNRGFGIQLYNSAASRGNLIESNLCYGDGGNENGVTEVILYPQGGAGNIFRGNTLISGSNYAAVVQGGSTVLMTNNVFIGATAGLYPLGTILGDHNLTNPASAFVSTDRAIYWPSTNSPLRGTGLGGADIGWQGYSASAVTATNDYSVAGADFWGTFSTGIAPAIISQPANAGTTNGGSATFTVTASGTSPLSYQWWFNGSAVGSDSSSYTRSNCSTNDSGLSVYCGVTNAYGGLVSGSAVLTVTNAPTPPTTTVIFGNGTVTFNMQ